MEKESRQVRKARQQADEKEKKRIMKELQLSDFTYVADDNNATLSADYRFYESHTGTQDAGETGNPFRQDGHAIDCGFPLCRDT